MADNTRASFRPAWWLPGPHLQTLWQPLFRRNPQPKLRRERITTPDGDFLDLDWHEKGQGPLVLLLHGLSGSSKSAYIRGMQAALAASGFDSVCLNFRGCSGEPNQTSRGYHSGETNDLEWVIASVRERRPGVPLMAAGYSLGGNMLLKWLGEKGNQHGLCAAAAVSAPLRLDLCASRLDRGLSRLYRNQLLRELKDYVRTKIEALRSGEHLEEARKLEALGDLKPIRSFWEYDGRVVAGLYGFKNAADYYAHSSAGRYVAGILCETLIVHALDDPFMTPEVVDLPAPPPTCVQLEISASGGHVGFVGGPHPLRPRYWLEERIVAFFKDHAPPV